eukprot:UN33787
MNKIMNGSGIVGLKVRGVDRIDAVGLVPNRNDQMFTVKNYRGEETELKREWKYTFYINTYGKNIETSVKCRRFHDYKQLVSDCEVFCALLQLDKGAEADVFLRRKKRVF